MGRDVPKNSLAVIGNNAFIPDSRYNAVVYRAFSAVRLSTSGAADG